MTTLHSTRGANYWSSRPVTRMDLMVGPYEDIASDDVPGFTEALVKAMPGLEAHRCSIGERGGFILRLRRGTYAPHIIEHVALELLGENDLVVALVDDVPGVIQQIRAVTTSGVQ